MRTIILLAVGLVCVNAVHAQVGLPTEASAQVGSSISSDGTAPNTNAMLDVKSPSTGDGKGMLIPRVTGNQRTNANASLAGGLLDGSGNLRGGAAQGLIVYQTDGVQGLYFNTSQTAAPTWMHLGIRDDYGFSVGIGANGYNGGTAIGLDANGADWGAAMGYQANGKAGVAVGRSANGYYGTVMGDQANGTNSGVAIGYTASGTDYGVALGNAANGSFYGAAMGYQANGYFSGAALGAQANGYWYGSVVGYRANGYNFGSAVGHYANATNYGAAMGYYANGAVTGAAVGVSANGADNGAAMGYAADGHSYGAAVGRSANGSTYGAAIGREANGTNSGAALGYQANGSITGVAVGVSANGAIYGVAVGYLANGYWYGAAMGLNADGGENGVAVGGGANGNNAGVAVGRNAIGNNAGATVGNTADGSDIGTAMGNGANGAKSGAAVGWNANGSKTNVAIGAYATALGGTERIAIGHYVTNNVDNSVVIRGTLYLDGGTGVVARTNFGGAWFAKAFEIDHPLDPENKILRHFCLEGPQVWNVYAGNAKLVNGQAVVQLPDYYSALNLAGSEIYSLTPIGGRADLWVQEEVSDNCFLIGGEKDIKVSWTVKVLRNDPGCLEDLSRRPVEQMKNEIR